MDTARKFSVSELTERIREKLDGFFNSIIVEGELSNWRPSSTGHWYFTLKDPGAILSGVMFKHRFKTLSFAPRDGMLLRVRGNISVYGQRGAYQIVCDDMEPAGTGDILAIVEKRKQALAEEGLFDQERKKPIPRFPRAVGVVSSPSGAAVRDILAIVQRRAPGIHVIILPAPVQGSEAASIIARRIEQANQWSLADVIILGRGGGSLEDLLPFSEEAVVRAVGASEIPIISAVGHEIDYVLSDFAADLRAPTPSAAAELVSANREETLRFIRNMEKTMLHLLQTRIEKVQTVITFFNADDLEYRVRSILQPRLVRFDDAKEKLLHSLLERITSLRRRLELAKRSLEAGSPQAILERGYSVVTNKDTGKLVRTAEEVKAGESLIIRPLSGIITATAEKIETSEGL
ncbi:MAG: exodeoxyribonuclease VII large subunit [Treponema sp.]|jgi:exodeoxyribonuclease VII large subunit|nr:exodeoxyribonuclease VII large subunit [Treponema sp.]